MDRSTMYRCSLPHYRIDGTVYFVTWRLNQSQCELKPIERSIIVGTIKFFEGIRYKLYSYVVMNDHVHVIVQPEHSISLEKIVHSWKSYSARRLQQEFGRKNSVWQTEYFDRIVRNDKELEEKSRYIVNNPRQRWPGSEYYEWVG